MIGIDIGSHSVKMVELERDGASFSLVSSGVVSIKGVVVDKLVDDKEYAAIGTVIAKLFKEGGFSSKNVIVSIPESLCFTRTIKFPPLTDSEIASAVKWESEQYIPIPIKEAVIQHTVIERRDNVTPPEVIVLLVAAPRAVVEKYIKVVQAAGLNPVAVETELLALARSLAPQDKTVMIVDFGAGSSDISIVKNGLLAFSRSIPIAGDAFTRAVSQGLGITQTQAEEYKKTYGLSQKELEGKIKTALSPVLSMVTDEIKKAVHFFQTEEKGEAPSAIIVSGGTSGMPQITSSLSALLGMEVIIGNPFKNVVLDPETAKKLAPYSPLYSVAVGLAMREE